MSNGDDPHRDIEAAVPFLVRCLGISRISGCRVDVALLLFLVYRKQGSLRPSTGMIGDKEETGFC